MKKYIFILENTQNGFFTKIEMINNYLNKINLTIYSDTTWSQSFTID